MASPSRPLGTTGTASNCAQAVALASGQYDDKALPRPAEPRPATPDYDFVEQPSQDFFCPVTMELVMEPQQTSCCGNHVSPEASARLQIEGKTCPMCNEQQWTAALDKYHRRRVRAIRVRCPHKRSGCNWEGDVGGVERHAASCPKRPWECPHCALRCMYGEGEGKHWPACSKFPEPCPNGCEVGSVERCHLEQHCRECPLEPVTCEMREFGCSAVVPLRDLATHMRESELQHLTAMAVLNLRLTRQLQHDAAEKDEKIAHLQLEMTKQKEALKREITNEMNKQKEELKKEITKQKEEQEALKKVMMEQKEQLAKEFTNRNEELKKVMSELKEELKKEMSEQKEELGTVINRLDQLKRESHEVKEGVTKLSATAHHIAVHTTGDCDMCKVITFSRYSERKRANVAIPGDEFYSCEQGYKFHLNILYSSNDVAIFLYVGEYDDQLLWPVKVKVRLELLNQAGDHHHVVRSNAWEWKKEKKGGCEIIDIVKYADLEKRDDGVQYMMNDCLKFRFHFTVQAA